MSRPASVIVHSAAVRRLRRGGAWLYESDLVRVVRDAETGAAAIVYDERRDLVGVGLWDPTSPLRVRMLSIGSTVDVSGALFADRITAAAQRRDTFIGADTTGYRVVHGENDLLPGLVIDRYGDVAVIKLYAVSLLRWLESIVAAAVDSLGVSCVVVRSSREVAAHGGPDGAIVVGALPDEVIFLENGLRFGCDPVRGQKTGFFLDQRENRARAGTIAHGARVLNVFAYSGGFSLYAARGGAPEVTSVDLSAPALAEAQKNFARNEYLATVAACRHRTVAADAFAELREMAARRERFDIVIVDPPSFAKQAGEVERALSSYGRLAALAADLTDRNGVLVAASCSSRVSATVFGETIDATLARSGHPFELEAITTHAPDHPVLVAGSEYLKARWYRRAARG